MAGVNAEMWPLCRMTYPREYVGRTLEEVPLGRPAFRSWILLFGVLPIDYDDLVLTQVMAPRGFREESTMWTQRSWVHERSIEAVAAGCIVIDRVSFQPRLEMLSPMFGAIFRLAFWNRHRRLRAIFEKYEG